MLHVFDHFKTIMTHKKWVAKYCFKCGLYIQGITHDLSKFSPTEFGEGIKYWTGKGSPNNEARKQTGISNAWLHHKGRNKHHYEYWVDYGEKSPQILKGYDMPKKYIAEMICDRVAACRTYYGDSYTTRQPLDYYMKTANDAWFISHNTKLALEKFLTMVAEEGEDKTFAYIKNVYLKDTGEKENDKDR